MLFTHSFFRFLLFEMWMDDTLWTYRWFWFLSFFLHLSPSQKNGDCSVRVSGRRLVQICVTLKLTFDLNFISAGWFGESRLCKNALDCFAVCVSPTISMTGYCTLCTMLWLTSLWRIVTCMRAAYIQYTGMNFNANHTVNRLIRQ